MCCSDSNKCCYSNQSLGLLLGFQASPGAIIYEKQAVSSQDPKHAPQHIIKGWVCRKALCLYKGTIAQTVLLFNCNSSLSARSLKVYAWFSLPPFYAYNNCLREIRFRNGDGLKKLMANGWGCQYP